MSFTFEDHFSAHADGYAAHRPAYPPELVDYLASLPARTKLAWDAGCGSGQLSVPLAGRFDRVVGTDASPQQLARATPHPRVEYVNAAAEASGLPEGAVDLCVAAQAAHWFDIDAYYAEVERVAAPGGIVALVTYGLLEIDDAIDPVLRAFHSGTLAECWPHERVHVESGYQTLPFPFDEIETPSLSIDAAWTLPDLLGYVATWSAIRTLERATAAEPLAAFRERLTAAWGDPARSRPVRFPLAIRAGRTS